MIERRWISIQEVAELLSIHEKTAYGWAARGVLPSIRIVGVLRVDWRRLEELFERQLVRKGPAR